MNFASLPSPESQAVALDEIAAEYLVQAQRDPVKVNCEFSVQTQVQRQIFDITNARMKTRYALTGADKTSYLRRHWLVPPAYRNRPEEILQETSYPCWGTPLSADATKGLVSRGWTSQAGVADMALYAMPNVVAAVGEVKPSWIQVLSQGRFEEMFNTVAERDGKFTFLRYRESPDSATCNAAIRQMWGELLATQTRLGAFTNGHFVMFYARTGDQELTFSDLLDWEDLRVHDAFAGLSLAAADSVLCVPRRKRRNEEHYRQSIKDSMLEILDSVCPAAERRIAFEK